MYRDTPPWTTAKLSQFEFSNHLHLSVTAAAGRLRSRMDGEQSHCMHGRLFT